ncbi:dihydroorotate dehydrogenase [Metabacillus endolithicus]|uniref:Dihydroorotate dehydrogenase n=2 Tax=Metabacillus endolithicus TaxID=1535204 RepID=A0ABW5BU39_9BACI|nr:dihydroorotate dehydrogenase [Metabacillus endolithicus]UPG64833.1 dihydroorotate dehydrogenase [Metabacillus endolithicus]
MPDWSYHTMFKHILTKVPGHIGREFIHRSMNSIASIPGGNQLIHFLGHMNPSPTLAVKLFGIPFSSPVGLSGKVDPLLSGTRAFSNLGFSFVEVGPVTKRKQQPSVKPYYERETLNVIFPEELESLGIDETVEKLQGYNGVNLKKLIRLKGSNEEIIELIKKLSSFSDAFILDFKVDILDHFITVIKERSKNLPILLAITPDQLSSKNDQLSCLIEAGKIDGVVIDADCEDSSFTSLKACVNKIRSIHKHIPLIVSGGINEPEDALEIYHAGVNLFMLSSGYITSGPGLPKRINELLDNNQKREPEIFSGWIWYWLFGLAVFIGGLLALLFSMTRIVLPYDEHFLGISRNDILNFNKNLLYFMAHDRMTLAGTMISGGILYMSLARYGIKYGIHWCRKAVNIGAITGFLGILLFIGFGYFDWLHGLFWLILLPFFLKGYFSTKTINATPVSVNKRNHQAWKLSLYGQLAFIILGFAFIIGGLVISYIGATFVFVQTDIGYLCMPPEMIKKYNEALIPVIAHDRAGFGSALFSVGLLVLMISLWGFREGDKWVWWSMLIGGFPAFLAGITIHFVIGYTTFAHLLPAYVAVALYIFGLIFTYSFLMKGENK